jgi:hypothetical protein
MTRSIKYYSQEILSLIKIYMAEQIFQQAMNLPLKKAFKN